LLAGVAGSCYPDDDSWKYFNNRCYWFGDSGVAKTWYDAEAYCKEKGGHLASIHDDMTNSFIMGQVRSRQGMGGESWFYKRGAWGKGYYDACGWFL
jgi:hypothetical protein